MIWAPRRAVNNYAVYLFHFIKVRIPFGFLYLNLLSLKLQRGEAKCFLMNARPDPDFKYFSNSKALYLSLNATWVTSSTGRRFSVAGTYPLLWRSILSSRFSVQPVYGFPSAH